MPSQLIDRAEIETAPYSGSAICVQLEAVEGKHSAGKSRQSSAAIPGGVELREWFLVEYGRIGMHGTRFEQRKHPLNEVVVPFEKIVEPSVESRRGGGARGSSDMSL